MLNVTDLNISGTVKKAFTILYDHWMDTQNGASIPHKSDINPMKIHKILPEVAIMERIDQDTVVYRLAGTELAERSGFDLTGLNTLETFPANVREAISNAYIKVAKKPCAAYHKVIMSFEKGMECELECLYLPLSDDDGEACYLIVLMFVEDKAKFNIVNLNKNIGYKIPAIEYLDIGFGAYESDIIPSHTATIYKPR